MITDDTVVVVCANCLTAACWHYKFMCQKYRTAGLTKKTVKELRELKLESEHYWHIDPDTGVARES